MADFDMGKFKDAKDLQKYCENLTLTNQSLQQQVERLTGEINHLKELLDKAVPSAFEESLKPKENAEELLLREINKYNTISLTFVNVPLEKEDTQKLKMCVDALVAFRNKGDIKKKDNKKEEPQDVNELMRLAMTPDKEDVQ